ncbi:hypothetical protein BCR35DRAFT_299710 [Leucosporidium creatinivorum]|uniref:Uncharacterized protein n=1 Tax=Leucosporidium creatinivorum TaxID=106004 RepID=A0A1Y2G0H8_9BASI|nr:hypothetical protein BCR35DRAFT_299710 [Leucosporidium creatinivorum]
MSAPPPVERPSRSTSAFSRLAGIVPSALSGSSASSGGSYGPQGSNSSTSSLPTNLIGATPARAQDALEALASADQSRLRNTSADGRRGDKSRSRERTAGDPSLAAYITQNRMVASGSGGAGAYWGGEALPPNASGSNFSMFAPGGSSFGGGGENASHFFPAGASAFSFEGGGGEIGSYRSSSGSPSLFNSQSRFTLAEQSSIPENTSGFMPSGSLAASWEPSSAASARARGESPVGGGRKMKESSRGLRFAVHTASRDRAMVGLAKPPGEGEQGRVAVAGRTCLKVLKVPHGGPRRGVDTPSHSHKSGSSIAYRRSRTRGLALGRNEDEDSASEKAAEREEVLETLDVRLGAKLGPAYLFSDVRWGYEATSNKLATSFTNGAVALWDLGNGATVKVSHQIKYEHDRAVNRVVFGGQSGSWLMSGGQDGQMKLWDIREPRPASLILKASSPVRHLAFSPSVAQPFTLVAACGSGTLIRYDIRYTGRQGGGAIDRIAGHVGSCLAMDWRDNLDGERSDTAGGNREGGWVATGGLDKTIKIWDFSLPTLSTKPARTLHASQPVQAIAWHPTRPTELASSPLPLLSVDGGVDDAPPPTPTTEVPLMKDVGGGAWKNEVEVWDTRRPYFPKLAIKTDEPTSALTYNDDETIWSTSKSSTTFLQHDINSDSYALLDSVERPSAPWNLEGEMVFVEDPRHPNKNSPFRTPSPARTPERGGIDSPAYRPDSLINSVANIDPDFHPGAFTYLANSLQLVGTSFSEICDANAEAYSYAERPDASQLWETLKIWLDDAPFLPDSPPLTPPETESDNRSAPPAGPSLPSRLDEWLLSPVTPSTPSSDLKSSNPPSRLSFSNSLALRVTASHSPRLLPTESKIPLDDFSEESTASDNDPSPPLQTGYSYYPELSSASSDSDHPIQSRLRKLSSSTHAGPNKLVRSFSALNPPTGRRSRSSTLAGGEAPLDVAGDEILLDPPLPPRPSSATRLQSRRPSSSSGSDSGDEAPSQQHQRIRAAKIQALQSSLTKRRGSAGDQRRPALSRDSMQVKGSRRPSNDVAGPNMSRRGSVPFAAFSRSVGVDQVAKPKEMGPSPKELKEAASLAHTNEATRLIKEQIKISLQDYADMGDHQLCATVCCVLKDKEMDFSPLFVARVTKAYLDLLRRSKLHTAAAAINKYCATASLRALTQNTVVFHTACGQCGKALDQPPFGVCSRCSAQVTRCCICHLVVRSLYLCCAACGHGAHPDCLASFAAALAPRSVRHSHDASPHDASHPSTPGIGTPLRAWMWGEDGEDGEEETVELASAEADEKRKERLELLNSCPAGLCGHSPCLLTLALEQL